MFKKILVPVDKSNTSLKGMEAAVHLAKDQKAKLEIIHIVDERFVGYGDIYVDFSELISALKKSGTELLDKMAAIAKKEKVDFHCKLVELTSAEDRIADRIIAEAGACNADLIVIGSHGRKGLNRMFIGSVAENVLRSTQLPILLVRGE